MVHPSLSDNSETTEYLVDESLRFAVAIDESATASKPVWFTVVGDESVLFSCPMSPTAAIHIGDQLRSAGARAELRRQ